MSNRWLTRPLAKIGAFGTAGIANPHTSRSAALRRGPHAADGGWLTAEAPPMTSRKPKDSTGYFSATRHPLECLLFLLPLLAAYEGGVAWLGGDQADRMRNG